MRERLHTFRIDCGRYSGSVKAKTVGEAWRELTKGARFGFGQIARFRQGTGEYHYCLPKWLDSQDALKALK